MKKEMQMYRTNICKPKGEGGGVNRVAGIDIRTYIHTYIHIDISA